MIIPNSQHADRHRECGRHSGIPECCIDWFLGPWLDTVVHSPKLWRSYWHANLDRVGPAPEYIRCPICIQQNRAEQTRECDCEIKDW